MPVPHYHACWQPINRGYVGREVQRETRVGTFETADAQIKNKGNLALMVAGTEGHELRMTTVANGHYEIRSREDNELWALAWVQPCVLLSCRAEHVTKTH